MIYWSTLTFILYVVIGLIVIYSMRMASENRTILRIENFSYNLGYVVFFISLWALAICRNVDNGLGGKDIGRYINSFLNASSRQITINGFFSSEDTDPLFLLIVRCLRSLTDNKTIYLGVMYGIIVLGYLLFIKSNCPTKISYIPFFLLLYPYLKSFCTLRSSVAIAVILIGMCIHEKKRLLGWIVIISGFFIHKSAFLYIPFFIFAYLFRKYKENISTRKLVGISALYLVMVYYLSSAFKSLFGNTFLTGNYAYYAGALRGSSFVDRIPLYFMQIVLATFMIIYNKTIQSYIEEQDQDSARKMELIRLCCIYDIIIIPAAYMFGVWRANEYFYIPRIIMWGIIISAISKKSRSNTSRLFINLIAFGLSLFWFYFRISHEYTELGIMPYQPWL